MPCFFGVGGVHGLGNIISEVHRTDAMRVGGVILRIGTQHDLCCLNHRARGVLELVVLHD